MKGEGLNNEAVKQRLSALKDKINKNEWNIHFQNAEHGSLILNVVVYNCVFLWKFHVSRPIEVVC